MDEDATVDYITGTFADVQTQSVGGYTFFFFGADRMFPFATLGTVDDDYDNASNLNRPGVYRLNVGVSRKTYHELFGEMPPTAAESNLQTTYDYAALDQLMPHPIYAPQSWVCVLNPAGATLEKVKGLLAEGYERAVMRESKRAEADAADT